MLGDKIRQRREQLGMTQDELGARLNINKQTVYRYEAGTNQPSVDVLARIAAELEVTADWLLGLVDEPNYRLSEADLSPVERKLIDAIRHGELADAMQAALDIAKHQQKSSVSGVQPAKQG